MDSSRMNRGCCGANNMQTRPAASNNMELKMEPRNFPRKMQHVDHMIPAMAYVPMQRFEQIYDLSTALKNGTLFPELCKPFGGGGGGGGRGGRRGQRAKSCSPGLIRSALLLLK